jgi:uncharacterized repeat protein (TIGR03803 family)
MRMKSLALARVLGLAAMAVLVACAGGSMPATTGVPVGLPASVDAGPLNHGVETVLHSFSGPEGAGPVSNMLAGRAGVLYGTTLFGGLGSGTAFELRPGPTGYREKVLYDFKGGLDGKSPWGIVSDASGAFYGITFVGGSSGNGGNGWGTVYKLTPGTSGYTETVLYRFTGNPGGYEPIGPPVIASDGSIYGVTSFGGPHNAGVVFRLAPHNGAYQESDVYGFSGGADGNLPQAGLTIDKHGNIYGTTMYGGSMQGYCNGGCGTVFEVTPGASGYSFRVIHAFTGADGNLPFGTLTVNERTGAVFGTTYWGGTYQVGTVFKLSPHGSSFSESVLHSFNGDADGFLPEGTLLLERGGTLYGTAALGGGGCNGIGCGTVFSLTPSGSGYSFHVVLAFKPPINGAEPQQTNLIRDASGALYGTTRSGGSATTCSDGGPGGAKGCGTVFKLNLPSPPPAR